MTRSFFFDQLTQEYGFDYTGYDDYQTVENIPMVRGHEAVFYSRVRMYGRDACGLCR